MKTITFRYFDVSDQALTLQTQDHWSRIEAYRRYAQYKYPNKRKENEGFSSTQNRDN